MNNIVLKIVVKQYCIRNKFVPNRTSIFEEIIKRALIIFADRIGKNLHSSLRKMIDHNVR